ncbi:unnamed protein product [Chondrus crispus]|uniref:Uncharacterized protein n=1 Tax=Chondrus crispus TaxID=2769 RepID=R7QNL6_CHOCR|nr:unnamed protein product [Chondrus crispus]CDF39699.1 unnamed protein product [Chondrus crispus]|eukprot:XP_005709993.1 unnamed protein product [Chondrus crispus]
MFAAAAIASAGSTPFLPSPTDATPPAGVSNLMRRCLSLANLFLDASIRLASLTVSSSSRSSSFDRRYWTASWFFRMHSYS